MSTRCACGRGKYADAACCDVCWNKGAAYDSPGDNNNYCSCGQPKYADASCCSVCWERGSGYADR